VAGAVWPTTVNGGCETAVLMLARIAVPRLVASSVTVNGTPAATVVVETTSRPVKGLSVAAEAVPAGLSSPVPASAITRARRVKPE
jgi:hypothetical protein